MLNIFHPTGGGGVGDTIFSRVPLPDFILIVVYPFCPFASPMYFSPF